ncbi:hypothetical protein QAD02_017022 [Eretmocerus hayati]|uniref:Uncharacterized protein n=1 Tax=Eretmocerus hayati TaxID=131215 RepID=A0ACC2PC78_9HYME|nr:hypothetical protein QAD02_017022 [Eretmocerus hayati]
MDEELLHVWRGEDKVRVILPSECPPGDGYPIKLVNVGNHVFLATSGHAVYHGQVQEADGTSKVEPPFLELTRTQLSAVDLSSNSKFVFLVTTDGRVLKAQPDDLTVIDTIVLKEDFKYCSHGCRLDNHVTKVAKIAVNDDAALFMTETGQLWASGDLPQIDIKSQEPHYVAFFEEKIVLDLACGSNFYVVLVRKKSKSGKNDTDSEDGSEEVFVRSCTQCLNNTAPSPRSLASSDAGHPVTNIHQLSEAHSLNSLSAISSMSREDVPSMSGEESTKLNQLSAKNEDEIISTVGSLEKEEKKNNPLMINTEAAKQFFSRQLSWVSSYNTSKDDIPLDNIDNSANLIKQNVSSMANLVYEGVKTVGDKVVTLSRHVSGSSDVNDVKDDISGNSEDLEMNLSKKTAGSLFNNSQNEDFLCSSSVGSSEHESMKQRLNKKINVCINSGQSVIMTEVWTWGDVKYGQLGVGDVISRPRPQEVTVLRHCGVRKLACGTSHTLALTIDGRVFAWGRNNSMQITKYCKVDQRSPQLFSLNSYVHLTADERTRDIAAGGDQSFLLRVLDKSIVSLGIHSSSEAMSTLGLPNIETLAVRCVLCSDTLSSCIMAKEPITMASKLLAEELIMLDETLFVLKNLVTPLQKKSASTPEPNVYEFLCCTYKDLLDLQASNVHSFWKCHNQTLRVSEIVIVDNIDEGISIYKSFLKAISDIVALGGFAQISKLIDVLQKLSPYFKAKINCKEITNEVIISFALQQPLQCPNRYVSILKQLIILQQDNTEVEHLQDALDRWESVCKIQTKRLQEAEDTKKFWEGSGKSIHQFKTPDRRIIRESRTHPISLHNSGRFSSHWFILLTDIFIHVNGSNYTAHLLPLLWVDLTPDSDSLKNAISITTPEESFTLHTPTPADRSEWFHALQTAVRSNLHKSTSHMPPKIRTGSFSFTKHPVYRDAIYNGQWLNGKLHGSGKLEWGDNRTYVGQFHKGGIQGIGRMEMPTQGVYEGQWKDGQQNGFGVMNYINGEVYEGYFKDGQPHGHGMKKEGHFMASVASVYVGEWENGVKRGYGVMDDIKTGEKYLGSWYNNVRHGNGLIVTLDGVYYEGSFAQDIFSGHGIMVLEDGTDYQGEFKSVGVFGGKGVLTFSNEDKLEGNFSGAWDEGIKVTATLHINNKASDKSKTRKEPSSFGKLCAAPDEKWRAIFRQFYQQLGIQDEDGSSKSTHQLEIQKLWQNVAAIISKSQRSPQKRQFNNTCLVSSFSEKEDSSDQTRYDQLNKILYHGYEKLTLPVYEQIHKYLTHAFESPHHPLGILLNELATVYTATYGGVRVHPLLLEHAVKELTSITTRIYEAVILFFPALPKASEQCILRPDTNDENDEERVISAAAILHPILLPRVYSALFVLYALHDKKTDDAYWERLLKWNKQPNNTLLAFLGIDPKFWKDFDPAENDLFLNEAIETLQQLKTTFSAVEKLIVIKDTHYQIEVAIQQRLRENYKLSADELIPMLYFVVVRASVLQLGSEIHFIEDFMESYLRNGHIGYALTNLMGIYDHILKEKISMDD